jgi:hypothetical protein
MKKIILFVATIIMIACSKQDSLEYVTTSPIKQDTKFGIRSYEEALKIAQSAIPMLENSNKNTRGYSEKREINLEDCQIYKLDSKTRSSYNVNDTLIYVFNFEDNKGFVLVSASLGTDGILAIIEQGHCDVTKESGIGGFDLFIEMAKDYVAHATPKAPTGSKGSGINIRSETIRDIHYSVSPKLTVNWGQDCPEGDYCTNGISGCTNTAIAQIMSYYQYPTSIPLTYDNSNTSLSLNWSAMNNHTNHTYYETCNNTSAHNQIAKLVRQIGHLNNSTYWGYPSYQTSTQIWPDFISYPVYHTIKDSLGYSGVTKTDYNGAYARGQLDANHLLLVSGGASIDGSNRHTWVLDGYIYEDVLIYTYQQEGNGPWVLIETIDYYHNWVHFNWGFYGQNNGYFNSDIINSSSNDPSIPYKYSVILINMYH